MGNRAPEEGPDLDALFGGSDSGALGAASGFPHPGVEDANDTLSGSRPHPALLHAVSSIVCGDVGLAVASALRADSSHEAKDPDAPCLADLLEDASAALERRDWQLCASRADAARQRVRPDSAADADTRWQRDCDRDLYALTELLLALCTSAGEGNQHGALAALNHADRALLPPGVPQAVKPASLLFATILGQQAQAAVAQTFDPELSFPAEPTRPWTSLSSPLEKVAGEVQRVRAPDDDALRALVRARLPFLLEDSMGRWPAFSRWSNMGALHTALGHRVLPVELLHHPSSAGVDKREGAMQKRWEPMLGERFVQTYLGPSCESFGSPQDAGGDEPSPNSSIQARLEDGGAGGASSRIACLAPNHALLEQCAELRADVPAVPEIWRHVLGRPRRTTVWLGTHEAVTRCSCEADDVCIAQVHGLRRATLFPPEVGAACFPPPPAGEEGAKRSGRAKGRDCGSRAVDVDLEAPDVCSQLADQIVKSGMLAQVVDLTPGDMLYVPSGWWCQMKARSPGCSVSFWF